MLEGGPDGELDDGDGKEKRKDVSGWNLVNFFFTNFPTYCNNVSLYHVFAEVGDIADVYVARKVSKTGNKFGFARFFSFGNIQALENRLNRIKIGNFKLKENIARFEKPTSKPNQGCKKVEWVLDFPSKSRHVQCVNPSLPMNKIKLNSASVGESFMIHSVLDLHSLWFSVNVREYKVTNLGGSRFSLDFLHKEDGSFEVVGDGTSDQGNIGEGSSNGKLEEVIEENLSGAVGKRLSNLVQPVTYLRSNRSTSKAILKMSMEKSAKLRMGQGCGMTEFSLGMLAKLVQPVLMAHPVINFQSGFIALDVGQGVPSINEVQATSGSS